MGEGKYVNDLMPNDTNPNVSLRDILSTLTDNENSGDVELFFELTCQTHHPDEDTMRRIVAQQRLPCYGLLAVAAKHGRLDVCRLLVPKEFHGYQRTARRRWKGGHPIEQKIADAIHVARARGHKEIVTWLHTI
jgi:hypothetical protein